MHHPGTRSGAPRSHGPGRPDARRPAQSAAEGELQLPPTEAAVGDDRRAGCLRQEHRHFEIGGELEQLELAALLAVVKETVGQSDQRIDFLELRDAFQHVGDAVFGDLWKVFAQPRDQPVVRPHHEVALEVALEKRVDTEILSVWPPESVEQSVR